MEIDLSNVQITKDCIKQVNNIGGTIYHNICNGTQQYVPWGSYDYLRIISGAIILIFLMIFIIFAFISIKNDLKRFKTL